MTEYFEIHERDGCARIGELRLREPVSTPALADDVVVDGGSLWSADRSLPDGDDSTVTVLPHRGFPAGTDPTVQEAFLPDYPDVEYPSAAVIAPTIADDFGSDVYILSTAQGIVGHAAAFVEEIVAVREAIPDDSALYLPGVATPGNVSTLLYAGVDLVDTDRAVIRGTQGRYLTTDGEHRLDDLDELPCACPACRRPIEEFTREDCISHNVDALRSELSRVRTRIRDGTLRDYIEGQARHEQWHTAAFRRLDQQWGYVEKRTPLFRRAEITAATDDTINRVEIKRFADRVTSRYRARLDDYPLVLVPCSAHKPYSQSQSHRKFLDAIGYRGHVVSMTSPIGVVPQELELTYPAQHYDAVVTGHWSETEKQFVSDVLEAYLRRTDYPRVIAHVPGEGYREIVERAAGTLDLDVEFTVDDHPTTESSLSALDAALDGELAYPMQQRERATVRAIADYALGDGAGDEVFDSISIGGRYPSLRVDDADDEQLAAIVPQYGTLSFTLKGARRWVDSDAPVKRVEIDEFVPHGSVLAPGVLSADEQIRPGDEVIVEGPLAFGVGRAELSGPAMEESTRGIAVDVRHVEEK